MRDMYLWGKAVFTVIKQHMKQYALFSIFHTHIPFSASVGADTVAASCHGKGCWCRGFSRGDLKAVLLVVPLIRSQWLKQRQSAPWMFKDGCCYDVQGTGADRVWQTQARFELLSSLVKAFKDESFEQFFVCLVKSSLFHLNQTIMVTDQEDFRFFLLLKVCLEANLHLMLWSVHWAVTVQT